MRWLFSLRFPRITTTRFLSNSSARWRSLHRNYKRRDGSVSSIARPISNCINQKWTRPPADPASERAAAKGERDADGTKLVPDPSSAQIPSLASGNAKRKIEQPGLLATVFPSARLKSPLQDSTQKKVQAGRAGSPTRTTIISVGAISTPGCAGTFDRKSPTRDGEAASGRTPEGRRTTRKKECHRPILPKQPRLWHRWSKSNPSSKGRRS